MKKEVYISQGERVDWMEKFGVLAVNNETKRFEGITEDIPSDAIVRITSTFDRDKETEIDESNVSEHLMYEDGYSWQIGYILYNKQLKLVGYVCMIDSFGL